MTTEASTRRGRSKADPVQDLDKAKRLALRLGRLIARNLGVTEQDIPQRDPSGHAAVLRNRGKPIKVVASAVEGLLQNEETSAGAAMTVLGLLAFRLRSENRWSSSQRMAIAVVGVILMEGRASAQWATELRAEVDAYARDGYEPDWSWARPNHLSPDDVADIREAAGYQPIEFSFNLDPITRDTTPAASSKLKIMRLGLKGFRSIPNELELSTCDRGRPVSMIVTGDNGTGKSTLVSAIELATQGTIGREVPGSPGSSCTPVSLLSPSREAEVSVAFSDGTTSIRQVRSDGSLTGSPRLPDFSMTPISLQRADLIKFLDADPSTRGKLFVGMLGVDSTDPAVRDAEQELRQARERNLQVRRDVGSSIPADPTGRASLEKRLSDLFLSGLTERQWKGQRGVLPTRYVQISDRLKAAQKEAALAKARFQKQAELASLAYPKQIARLGRIVGDLSQPMTESVRSITGYSHFERLEVKIGQPVTGVTLRVRLRGGATVAPEQLFSEGVQDLIAILFFLEIAHAAAERGQAKILILDDIIQSVDAGIRVRLMEYIAQRFIDWQLFITCHDKLWREQLRSVLRGANHPFSEVELRGWEYEQGPRLQARDAGGDPSGPLREAVGSGATSAVAAAAGRLLEAIADRLSWTLPVAVPRNREDRYSLGDLWPPLRKKLRQSALDPVLGEVDRWLHLRNALGAHYNEFAESVSDQEADEFGRAVIALWEAVWCSSCGQWVTRSGSGVCSCRCGSLSFSY